MDVDIIPWLELALRWLHVITGIAWIGASFYFVWLDGNIRKAEGGNPLVAGELWAVHGGGFYHNQKYLVAPEQLPPHLHWFKYEAYFTWISGFLLLAVIYYLGADVFLIDKAKLALTPPEAIGISLAFLAGGWLVYDGLCRSPLGKDGPVFGAVWFLILTAAAYALTHIFSDRAAFIHVGAIVGTAMVANVFFVIIPNQKKVVASMLAGETPDRRARPSGQAALAAQQLHDLAGGADHDQQSLSHAVRQPHQLADPGEPQHLRHHDPPCLQSAAQGPAQLRAGHRRRVRLRPDDVYRRRRPASQRTGAGRFGAVRDGTRDSRQALHHVP